MATRRGIIGALAGAAVLMLGVTAAGCTHPVAGVAVPGRGDPARSTPADYREADHATFEYRPTVPWYSDFTFRTGAGQTCSMTSYLGQRYAHADCTGPRPDHDPGNWTVSADRQGPARVRPAATDPTGPADPPPPMLPARHRLSDGSADFVCGVDDAGATDCRVGDHGFVISATATTLY